MISTAEGVETKQQLETLLSVGCIEMQGYLFSKPRPAAEIVRMFLKTGERAIARM
jgi:EAL domain-containing protein (putative c-di-GMP-specific phosphodiesterase class I)